MLHCIPHINCLKLCGGYRSHPGPLISACHFWLICWKVIRLGPRSSARESGRYANSVNQTNGCQNGLALIEFREREREREKNVAGASHLGEQQTACLDLEMEFEMRNKLWNNTERRITKCLEVAAAVVAVGMEHLGIEDRGGQLDRANGMPGGN